ncbi:MAG: hypothetical protein WCF92_00140 [bacterium]
MTYLLRAKFKKEIISEFLVPKKPSSKVVIFLCGMPTYPSKEKYLALSNFFSNKGYWCFVPRYRGTWESEGKLFAKSPHLDVVDLINELSKGFSDLWSGEKYKIENPEVVLIGSSFGGPAALLSSKNPNVKKVITFSSVLDWRYENETVEPVPKLSKFVGEAFGNGYRIAKDGWKKIEKGEIYNPATELEKIDGSKCLVIHAQDDEVVSIKPLKPFIIKTGAKLNLVKKGGHLGMAILEKRFYKKCMEFIRSK